MSPKDQEGIDAEIRESMQRRRGYADFFGWPKNRDMKEYGVAELLGKSLQADGALFFSDIKIRGRGNDPPDLEAVDESGNRIAIEVTELVDGDAIHAHRIGRTRQIAEWGKANFLASLRALLVAKDARFQTLKGAPYPGGYVVVVFTDETSLPRPTVAEHLLGHRFSGLTHINRAFLLLSYDPAVKCYPYFELQLQ